MCLRLNHPNQSPEAGAAGTADAAGPAEAAEAAPITVVSGGKTATATVVADLGEATETAAPTPAPTKESKDSGSVVFFSSLFLFFF